MGQLRGSNRAYRGGDQHGDLKREISDFGGSQRCNIGKDTTKGNTWRRVNTPGQGLFSPLLMHKKREDEDI